MPRKGKEPAGLRRWRLAHRAKRKARRSARSSGGSKTPGFAAQYVNAKTAVQLLSPATDAAIGGLESKSLANAETDLRYRYGSAGATTTIEGAASAIVQRVVDNKFHQTQALAHKSVTAGLPEVYALAKTWEDSNSIRDGHANFVEITTGYNPNFSTFKLDRAKPYLTLKYGGIVARKVINGVPAFARPIKKALNMAGLTL